MIGRFRQGAMHLFARMLDSVGALLGAAEAAPRTVRVVMHVLHTRSDNRTQSEWRSLIEAQIRSLNDSFSGQTPPGVMPAADTGIRFACEWDRCVIKTVPDASSFDPKAARKVAKPSDGRYALNIWVVPNMPDGYGYGYGDSPWWAHRSIHGVFITASEFAGKACTHEVGHWLGLEHVNLDNLDDTNDPSPDNFMDISSDNQQWARFSPLQIARMRRSLFVFRRGTISPKSAPAASRGSQ